MKHKILIPALIFCMLVGMAPSAMVAAEGGAVDKSVAVLSALGIFNDTDGEVTRAELAYIMCRLLGIEPHYTVNIFDDVDDGSEYKNYILTAFNMNLIGETQMNRFSPNALANLADVSEALVKALGYEAVSNGNYGVKAVELGLFKGVNTVSALNREKVARMLYNSLDVQLMERVHSNVDGVKKSQKTLLSSMGVVRRSGRLTAIGITGLDGLRSPKGMINIDEVNYKYAGSIPNEYVGRLIEYYVKEVDGDNVIAAVYFRDNDEYSSYPRAQIEGFSFENSYLEMTLKDRRRIQIDYDAYVIFNGGSATLTPAMIASFREGRVTMTDFDGDSRMDVLHIVSTVGAIVQGSNYYGKGIVCKHNFEYINLEVLTAEYRIYKNGQECTYNDIYEDDVLDIASDTMDASGLNIESARLVQIFVTDDKRNIQVTSINDIDNTIDAEGEVFEKSVQMSAYAAAGIVAPISPGGVYEVHLDSYGAIAFVKSSDEAEYTFGYIIRSGENTQTLGAEFKIKLIDDKGIIKTYIVSDKCRTDGVMLKSNKAPIVAALSTQQVIRFKLGANDELIEIDTKTVNPAWETEKSSLSEDLPQQTLQYFSSNQNFAGKVTASSGTVIFRVPFPETGYEDKMFSLGSTSSFSNSQSYEISAYNLGDFNMADVLVQYSADNSSTSFTRSQPLAIIKKVTFAINEDGQSVYKFRLLSNYNELELNSCLPSEMSVSDCPVTTNDPSYFEDEISPSVLKKGDTIRYSLNAAGEIKFVQRMVDVDNMPNYHLNYQREYAPSFAQIYKARDGFAELVLQEDLNNLTRADFSVYKFEGCIIVYNMCTDTFEFVARERIPSYTAYGNKVKAFMQMSWADVNNSVIYVIE